MWTLGSQKLFNFPSNRHSVEDLRGLKVFSGKHLRCLTSISILNSATTNSLLFLFWWKIPKKKNWMEYPTNFLTYSCLLFWTTLKPTYTKVPFIKKNLLLYYRLGMYFEWYTKIPKCLHKWGNTKYSWDTSLMTTTGWPVHVSLRPVNEGVERSVPVTAYPSRSRERRGRPQTHETVSWVSKKRQGQFTVKGSLLPGTEGQGGTIKVWTARPQKVSPVNGVGINKW